MDIIEEFYNDESKPEHQQKYDLAHLQDIQKSSRQLMMALNEKNSQNVTPELYVIICRLK